MKGGNGDAVLAKRFDNRIHFLRNHHKVSRDCRFSAARRLEIDGGTQVHGIRNGHSAFHNFFGTWNSELVNAIVVSSTAPEDAVYLFGVEGDLRRSCRSR